MRRPFVILGSLLVAALAGCMSTRRVEYSRVVNTSVDSSGSVAHVNHAQFEERSWQGPWIGQPDQVRP